MGSAVGEVFGFDIGAAEGVTEGVSECNTVGFDVGVLEGGFEVGTDVAMLDIVGDIVGLNVSSPLKIVGEDVVTLFGVDETEGGRVGLGVRVPLNVGVSVSAEVANKVGASVFDVGRALAVAIGV